MWKCFFFQTGSRVAIFYRSLEKTTYLLIIKIVFAAINHCCMYIIFGSVSR